VFILKSFKSCVLEVRIPEELRARFAKVRILEGIVAVGRRRVPNGSVEVEERVDLNAECTEFAEKDGTPHPGCLRKECGNI